MVTVTVILMTSEAVAVVRAFFELSAAGDLARGAESLDPDVVWFGSRGGLDEDQVLRGRDAWRARRTTHRKLHLFTVRRRHQALAMWAGARRHSATHSVVV